MSRYTLPLAILLALLVTGTLEHGVSAASRRAPSGRYQGKPAAWWAHRAVANRKALNRTRRIASASNVDAAALTLDFECIHRYEGAWDANTGNGYEGGLQFGHQEWRTYGGQFAAHAYEASPAEQIAAAISYYAVSGFSPWPQTRKACGL